MDIRIYQFCGTKEKAEAYRNEALESEVTKDAKIFHIPGCDFGEYLVVRVVD